MDSSLTTHKVKAFVLTFLAYSCFHMVRKPPSVVKSVLHPVSSTGKSVYDPEMNPGWAPFNNDIVPEKVSAAGFKVSGAFNHTMNGLYVCRERGATICVEFTLGTNTISREDVLCPTGFSSPCWLIMDNGELVFAQDYNGTLPAQNVASDAPDVVHWKRRMIDGRFETDKILKLLPNVTNGGTLLGLLDTVFLGFYTMGLFVSGYLGDRVDLRWLLCIGMWGSGISLFLLAMAHVFEIHSISYFIMVNAMFGLLQSTGWPSVVAIMGSWFGHGARGTIMGVWNCHTSIGNILGSVITAASVGAGMHKEDWPLGYAVPGVIICTAGVVVFTFLVPKPEDVGMVIEQELDSPLLDDDAVEDPVPNRGFYHTLVQALAIPGVIQFSLSLMFCKMTSYSLLYWGPYYLGSVGFTSEKSGYLCSFFDIGGMFGGMMAGFLSDRYPAAIVAFVFQIFSVPVILFYYTQTSAHGPDVTLNVALMILNGFFINAPYSLITTAVTADLGTKVKGDTKLLAFVTGLIDGTGSFGAMIQGVVVGSMSADSWANVWHFLCLAQVLSAAMISGLFYEEVKQRYM